MVYFYTATSRRCRGAMWSIFAPALTGRPIPEPRDTFLQQESLLPGGLPAGALRCELAEVDGIGLEWAMGRFSLG